jgi:CubicO group peptidase (beta-lactamase class C family)
MDLVNSPAFALKVSKLLQETHTPGLAVAIVQNSTIASNGFGLAHIDPPTNVTSDTLFDIASSSKSLTAASVGLLAVDDINYPQLYWDTPMSYLLPEDFVMSGDVYTNQVSVEDILSHRSGFPRHDFSYLSIRAEHPDTPQSITRNLRNLPTAAPIRTKLLYSNIMFIVASWLVEAMSGLKFAEYLRVNFFG